MSRNGSSWSSPLMLPQKGLLWATFPFFFSLMCSEKKNRRTAVFRAERSAEENAVSAKGSAASDAEPFAVAGTVPYIRQLPRPERRGWRSIFSFFSPTKGSEDDLLIEFHAHNKTAYQVTNGMLSRTGKEAFLRSTAAGKSFVAFQLCRERADAKIMWLTPGEYIWRMPLTYQKSAGSRVSENNPFLTHARSRLLTPGEGTARRRPHGRLDVKTGHVTERSNPLGSWPNEQKRSLSVV